jgi:hypothetical protein
MEHLLYLGQEVARCPRNSHDTNREGGLFDVPLDLPKVNEGKLQAFQQGLHRSCTTVPKASAVHVPKYGCQQLLAKRLREP